MGRPVLLGRVYFARRVAVAEVGQRVVARRQSVAVLAAAVCLTATLTAEIIAEPILLETGSTIEREFAGGQSHEYRFRLEEGQYAKILLFQRSINVAVECVGPDGRQRFEADSQRIDDSEIAELIGDASGMYRLRVYAPDPHAPPGQYNIALTEVEPAAEHHKSRVAAARAYAQAWKLVKQTSRESLGKSIASLETATGHWHAAGDLFEEASLAREGHRLATRGLLALIAVEVARLAASRARTGAVTLAPTDATVEALRRLVEDHFRRERYIAFYAERLAMTPDRLNDHVKRAIGVTAGHLIRQRMLTEAKRQLVFTNQAITEISYDLGFSDPSHFARFFRKNTSMTPQGFRARRGG